MRVDGIFFLFTSKILLSFFLHKLQCLENYSILIKYQNSSRPYKNFFTNTLVYIAEKLSGEWIDEIEKGISQIA
jgi:hypothetical protein